MEKISRRECHWELQPGPSPEGSWPARRARRRGKLPRKTTQKSAATGSTAAKSESVYKFASGSGAGAALRRQFHPRTQAARFSHVGIDVGRADSSGRGRLSRTALASQLGRVAVRDVGLRSA